MTALVANLLSAMSPFPATGLLRWAISLARRRADEIDASGKAVSPGFHQYAFMGNSITH